MRIKTRSQIILDEFNKSPLYKKRGKLLGINPNYSKFMEEKFVAIEDVKKFIKNWEWGADECLDEILRELSEVENDN